MHWKRTRRRWASWGLCSLLVTAGCQSVPTAAYLQSTRTAQVPAPSMPAAAASPTQTIQLASHAEPQQPTPVPETGAPVVATPKPVPICLDTVFRMAQNKNGQVRLAQMRVDEAYLDQEGARKNWLPEVSAGIGYWRHEGGIQDFYGNLLKTDYGGVFSGLEIRGKYDWKEVLYRRVEAERKFWLQKGELSKLTNENLLDASSTYIDLLAARTGMAVSLETEGRLNELLQQAEALAKIDPGLTVEVSRVRSELAAQKVLTIKLAAASKGASAKLAYLLGLDPCCDMEPMDARLVPIKLIDPSLPVQTFVDQALATGPGVRELDGLLRTVEAARNQNYGWQHWMPSIEISMQEGAFGAGPGNQLDWANRFDLELHLRWSLNEFVYAKRKRQQAEAHIQQVQVSFDDLRLKLTLGVQEARQSILGGVEQVSLAENHIKHADESYRLSEQRLRQNIKGRSTSEVLLALRSLGGARLEYLQAVRDLDKAQLRLYSLVATTDAPCQR